MIKMDPVVNANPEMKFSPDTPHARITRKGGAKAFGFDCRPAESLIS